MLCQVLQPPTVRPHHFVLPIACAVSLDQYLIDQAVRRARWYNGTPFSAPNPSTRKASLRLVFILVSANVFSSRDKTAPDSVTNVPSSRLKTTAYCWICPLSVHPSSGDLTSTRSPSM